MYKYKYLKYKYKCKQLQQGQGFNENTEYLYQALKNLIDSPNRLFLLVFGLCIYLKKNKIVEQDIPISLIRKLSNFYLIQLKKIFLVPSKIVKQCINSVYFFLKRISKLPLNDIKQYLGSSKDNIRRIERDIYQNDPEAWKTLKEKVYKHRNPKSRETRLGEDDEYFASQMMKNKQYGGARANDEKCSICLD